MASARSALVSPNNSSCLSSGALYAAPGILEPSNANETLKGESTLPCVSSALPPSKLNAGPDSTLCVGISFVVALGRFFLIEVCERVPSIPVKGLKGDFIFKFCTALVL